MSKTAQGAVAMVPDASGRMAELEAALAAERAENERLREAYQRLRLELELMRRRLFAAKAERLDTAQLELEFGHKLAELDALNQRLGMSADEVGANDGNDAPVETSTGRSQEQRRPSGRRDLSQQDLPVERVEIVDPELEGKAERIAWEESSQVQWRRGGHVRVVIARAKYKPVAAVEALAAENLASELAPEPAEELASATPAEPVIDRMPRIVTAPMPPMILPRSLATPSLIAHIVAEKFCDGLPLHRQEDRHARLGCRIDRGSMSRWIEEVGMTAGATVVAAMRAEALEHAFCIATDATGVLVQPIRGGDQPPRGCARGHYFVQIADADHVFFEYTPRETSNAVGELFRGFSGYVLADAKSVYDFLFQPPGQRSPPDDGAPDLAVRHEVGCWAHCRRKFWEAAVTTKDPVAREGLLRIQRLFDLDRSWKRRPVTERKMLRQLHLRPHTDAFFAWVAREYEHVKDRRGLLRSALGYAHRQNGPLTRFYDDGRLPLTNNQSERELRRVAVGRKAWLFVGSDDHAQAAGNLLSLVASARLHRLDPEAYLRDLFRVLPQWPRCRYLELAPRYWLATRARLDLRQLEPEVGWLTIPSPPPPEQSPPR